MSAIAVYRREEAPLFSEQEARIAHIIMGEVAWLHSAGWPIAKRVQQQQLSPRERTTLNFLLDGRGRKQIAAELAISENTVSGYIKEIYRTYRVNSHAELMRYFQQGDGGDRATAAG